ncbi:MAG TPA: hypothetical protein VJ813_13825 [Vicinamibacterales bacterium]|nr:hypothetical protein [Vicinamibacterales bacterium]
MRAILQRLLGGRRSRPSLTCYLRENGPIAYELDLFTSSPRDRADAMMSSELSWAWQGGVRGWTHLTRISLSAFLADVPAGVALVATEGELPTDVTNGAVAEWIRRFARLQPAPLAAVITVTADRQLLFVQQQASEPVNRLLDDWGIDKGAAERKAYARLGAASLEALADRL